jgi:NAD+ diphosphatase
MENNFKITSEVIKESKCDDLYFIFYKDSILIKFIENGVFIPTKFEVESFKPFFEDKFYIGELDGKACFALETSKELQLKEGFEFVKLRECGLLLDENLFTIAGRAKQIIHWDKTNKFCGRCGTKTENKVDERAKICPHCNNVMYPVICPAIIVAVTKGDKILLAHNKNFVSGRYSVIAGFVEAGEDLESAVKREVFEEVGIKVKNIKYYNSSSWSFPNSLMIGFFAQYEAEEIKVDGKEIECADWYSKDDLPDIPENFSIAGKLIRKFLNGLN